MSLKILYAGSPEAAEKTLQILFENQEKYGFEIVGVLTNPPTAKGRHKELVPTPVGLFAREKNLPVFEPEHLDSAARDSVSPLKADLLVCFAYGHIFGPKFLNLFPFGGINLHPSDLPRYRGCTPVQSAIKNQDKEMCIAIQKLGLAMDEGDILKKVPRIITEEDNGQSLLFESAETGAKLICEILEETAKNGKLPDGTPQSGEASYTGIITKEDVKINWSEGAAEIAAKVRAYYPDPSCWCLEKGLPLKILNAKVVPEDGEIYKLLAKDFGDAEPGNVCVCHAKMGIHIKTGNGFLNVLELQRQGKKPMNYKDFMNGARDFAGTILE